MINLKCVLHKQPMAVVNFVQATSGVDQDLFFLCPACAQVQSNVTALADNITTIKTQLDTQAANDVAPISGIRTP